MSGLQELLRWDDNTDMVARYERAFTEAAERRLSAALSEVHAISTDVAATMVRAASDLPAERLLHLARAPELQFRLRAARVSDEGRAALLTFLLHALQAELLLTGERLGVPHEDLWAAPGDVRIPQSGAINEVIALSSTIHVDLDSPYNRGDVDRRFATQQAAAPDARDRIVTSLRAALDIIAMASPTAHRFTEAFTTIVVCIHVPDLDDRIGSFSSSWYPGRSVLVNAHHMDVDELADSLLHEAIHSVIDVSELTGRMLRRPPVPGTTVTSPWTGATLTLEALLDAYFVWYGLMWLWQRSANSASPRDGVDDRIAQCRKGFMPTLDAVVGDARDAVHGATADAIEGLRAAVSFECAM